ncbi:VMAP-C domain-containing protein [Lentzea chajnantorensis]
MEQTPRAEPRAVLAVDMERFGDRSRTDLHRRVAHDGLYKALYTALSESSIDEPSWYKEDRGDGAMFLFTPDVPKKRLPDLLLNRLIANLLRHNATVTKEAQIRLRISLHYGEVTINPEGVVGDCVNLAFRLLEAAQLKEELAESSSVLAVIVSEPFYQEVLRNEPAAEPSAYRQINVAVKETTTSAWMRLSAESVQVAPQPSATTTPAEVKDHPIVGDGDQIGLLAELITRMPLMAGLDDRRLCLELVNTSLEPEPLSVTEFPDVRRHVFAIVLACAHRPRAVRALLRALRHLQPDAPELERISEVVSGMAPLDLFSDDDRRTLTELLRGTDFPRLAECYRAAAGSQAAPLPSGRQDAVDVLTRLERMNARPDGLPPALVLLEHLALHAGDVLSQRLWRFSEDQAKDMGLHAEQIALRGSISTETTDAVAPAEAALVLRLQPHGVLPDQYLLSEWRQTQAHWSPQRGGDHPGSLAELRVRAGELVAGAEGWAENASSISIEFILPKELLNLPVDQWLVPSDEITMPIGIDYPVTLRSLERSRDKEKRRRWRRRYAQLQAHLQAGDSPIDDAVHRSQLDGPRHRHLQKLAAKLALAEDVVLLVLADPPARPDSAGRQEVAIAFKSGVPALLWHREDCASKAFQTAVDDLLADGGLSKLPENVKKLRGQALYSDDCDTHPGSHISILLDDPNRQVEPLPQEVTAP